MRRLRVPGDALHEPRGEWRRQLRRLGAVPLLVFLVAGLLAGCGSGTTTTTAPQTTLTSLETATTSTVPETTTASLETTTTEASTTTTTPSTTTTTPTTPTTLAANEAVLYEITDWSSGTKGWAASGQWKTVAGMLVTDGSEDSIAVAPLDLKDQSNYTVEAEIQIVNTNAQNTFNLEARLINGVGYWGGYDSYWGGEMQVGFSGNKLAGANFTVDAGWHTYRLEVHDNTMKLLFDGAEVARAMDNHVLEPGTVGIHCVRGQINVRSFRVVAP